MKKIIIEDIKPTKIQERLKHSTPKKIHLPKLTKPYFSFLEVFLVVGIVSGVLLFGDKLV
jgi:hypothetical protein